MKYFIIAGERSGDLHASHLILALRQIDKQAQIVGWGGKLMKEAGAEILVEYKTFSYMGFWEVFRKLRKLRQKLVACRKDLENFTPDILILVDFPGFNMRVAAYAKSLGLKTCYYISPKLWAWNRGRIKQIRESIDLMLVIFPFEVQFYASLGYSVTYVGNPLVSYISEYQLDKALISKLKSNRKSIAFLPGSREQEIVHAMEVIDKLADVYDEYHFLVAGVDNVDISLYAPITNLKNVSLYFNKTYEVLKSSDVAIVTSGTATLEAALLDVPQIVVYKTGTTTYTIGRLLARIKYISLVNLLVNKELVTELVQSDYNPVDIAAELECLLNDAASKKRISEGYSEIQRLIGNANASENAAEAIVSLGRP